jgi:hypothetical protein
MARLLVTGAAALGLVFATPLWAAEPVPTGWTLGGQGYEAGLDRVTKHTGEASAFLKSPSGAGGGGAFGTLMQVVDAAAYRGSRLRFSGYARAANVAGWAGFWLRVDGPGAVLAFDNMAARPIKGSTDWRQYEVVLDAPAGATALAFGVLLAGGGQVWIDDLRLEAVDHSVAVTAASPAKH